MTNIKTDSARTDEQSPARLGVDTSRLICVSRDNLERLSTFRFHCDQCKRWLPALAFYAKVVDHESETMSETIYLARHGVKVKGFKELHQIGVCKDCAERPDSG